MTERSTSGEICGTATATLPWDNEFTTLNGSDQDHFVPCYKETIILRSLTLIIAPVGLAGNLVVLGLLGFHMHKNLFSIYLLNLAWADFLFLCCHTIGSLVILTDTSHLVPKFFNTVMIFQYLAGLNIVSAISTERCLSVLWPIWYRHRPRHLSAVICALLWALSLLLSILDGAYCGFLINDLESDACQEFELIILAWLAVLFVILTGSSLVLLTRILSFSQGMPPARLYVTILFTVLVFLLCGLPFGINWFFLFWIEKSDAPFFCHVFLVTLGLSCVNSCANPIIYFFSGCFRQRQRQTLKQALQRALQDTPEVEEGRTSLPQ